MAVLTLAGASGPLYRAMQGPCKGFPREGQTP